jgi:hypothetical protein
VQPTSYHLLTLLQELPCAYYATHTLPVTWQGKDGSVAIVNAEHSGVMYSCNSCLHPIFHAGNIAMKAKGGGGNETGVAFFIEPIQWMRAQRIHRSAPHFVCIGVCVALVTSLLDLRLSGSIECPNCRWAAALHVEVHFNQSTRFL